jgi:hypothetical protein
LSTKKGIRESVRLAYKNGLTNALIRTMLFCRKFYGTRLKFGKIGMNQNNVSKTQMLSHVRHYFEALFYPGIKYGDQCGANV